MVESNEKARAEKAAKFAAKQAKLKQQTSTSQQPQPKKVPDALPAFQDLTPLGHKKLLQSFDSPHFQAYSPQAVESSWYTWWEKSGYFRPESCSDVESSAKFAIPLPPPNVTGALHCGHALANSLQDTLIRWYRMRLASHLNPSFLSALLTTSGALKPYGFQAVTMLESRHSQSSKRRFGKRRRRRALILAGNSLLALSGIGRTNTISVSTTHSGSWAALWTGLERHLPWTKSSQQPQWRLSVAYMMRAISTDLLGL
jgi:tRNA synthetases class I (I, L, M and V)